MPTYMLLKGIYADKPALFQLLTLLLFIVAGGAFSSMIFMGLFSLIYGATANITSYPDMMRLFQLLSAVGTFLFPALVTAWLCSKKTGNYLFIGGIPSGRILLLTLISMLLLSPAISLTGLLNKQMELPAFLEPVESWMRMQEANAEHLTQILLSGKGSFILLANLFVIAVVAGITEEFLFRGALQRIIGKWTTNPHLVIWSAAFLFSAFHVQFFGFLPRLLLGAYFGYLLYWSQNIWIPVFAHFANNAFAVIGLSDNKLKDNEFITGDISNAHLLPYSVAALITLYLFYLCVKQIRLLLQKEIH